MSNLYTDDTKGEYVTAEETADAPEMLGKGYRIEGREPTIFRVVKNKNNPYVMIDRRPIENPALSYKAKGILTYLLSRPDGWEICMTDLIKRSTDGRASTRAGLKELEEAGHLKYDQSREKGRITGWIIRVYEVPNQPESDFRNLDSQPESDFQQVENRIQVLIIPSNTKKTNNKKEGASAKPPTPPEVKLFREVTRRFPHSANFEMVVESIGKVRARLERDVTADDLKPFYSFWTSKGYNPLNIAWLEWAETGHTPENGAWRPAKYKLDEPKGFQGIRDFLQMNGVAQNE